jgi:hypothetical protein
MGKGVVYMDVLLCGYGGWIARNQRRGGFVSVYLLLPMADLSWCTLTVNLLSVDLSQCLREREMRALWVFSFIDFLYYLAVRLLS